jgi:Leucine-rich repeat (LRR) protein
MLTNLKSLDIHSNNYINGEVVKHTLTLQIQITTQPYRTSIFKIPSGFGGIQNLVTFDVSGNYLSGSIPSDIWKLFPLPSMELGALKDLYFGANGSNWNFR